MHWAPRSSYRRRGSDSMHRKADPCDMDFGVVHVPRAQNRVIIKKAPIKHEIVSIHIMR